MSAKDGWPATRRIASPPPKPLIPTMPTRMLMVVSCCCWSRRLGESRCRRELGAVDHARVSERPRVDEGRRTRDEISREPSGRRSDAEAVAAETGGDVKARQ